MKTEDFNKLQDDLEEVLDAMDQVDSYDPRYAVLFAESDKIMDKIEGAMRGKDPCGERSQSELRFGDDSSY